MIRPQKSALSQDVTMKFCGKCGSEASDRDLSCPHCWASLSLDVSLSVAVMKVLGVLCGIVGVALFVFSDQLRTEGLVSCPYDLWLWAGAFIVMGFVFFYRKWPERDDS